LERPARVRQQPFVWSEAGRLQHRRGQRDRFLRCRRRAGRKNLANEDLTTARVQQLVQRGAEIAGAVEKEAQRLEVQLREFRVAVAPQLDARDGRGVAESRRW